MYEVVSKDIFHYVSLVLSSRHGLRPTLARKRVLWEGCWGSSQSQRNNRTIGLEMVGASRVPELAFRELLLWADQHQSATGTPFPRDSNSRPRAQGTVERDRGSLPKDQDSYQKNGGEEEGRKDLVAAAKIPPPIPGHTLFFPPDVL